jgi:hypothetical protein
MPEKPHITKAESRLSSALKFSYRALTEPDKTAGKAVYRQLLARQLTTPTPSAVHPWLLKTASVHELIFAGMMRCAH